MLRIKTRLKLIAEVALVSVGYVRITKLSGVLCLEEVIFIIIAVKINILEKEEIAMKKILFVNACIRGKEHSRTYKIAQSYLDKLQERYPVAIVERNLTDGGIGYLTELDFSAATGELRVAENYDMAEEFAAVDGIIIAAPFWEFAFPAALSCYLENVSVPNITFRYTAAGSEGLCKARFLLYIYTSGDVLKKDDNIGSALLTRLAKLYDIPHFDTLNVQGLDIDKAKTPEILNKALQMVTEKVEDVTKFL